MHNYVKRGAAIIISCVASIAMAQVAQPIQPAPALPVAPSPVVAAPAASNPADATHALTADDLSTFLDGLVPFALERGDVAGGVISVVKDGKVLFAKGYGYADLKTRTRPSPETTLFRPGSTSKLFTWTAVMQLVEQGKLDLDTDINQYLDFKIPGTRADTNSLAVLQLTMLQVLRMHQQLMARFAFHQSMKVVHP